MEHADWVAFLGRLHPMVLHLPIGLLAGVALLEFLGLVNRKAALRTAPLSLVVVAALSAIVTAVSGVVLAREPGYGGDTLEWHRWLGISAAALCTIAAGFRIASRGGTRAGALRGYRFTILGTLGVIGVTGHLGGSMTHGDDFLTEPLFPAPVVTPPESTIPHTVPRTSTSSPSTPANAPSFEIVSAFFHQRCTTCHGDSKQRGGLALHTAAAIAHGGDDGPVIAPGDPAASELIRRLRLPLDERGHMPPKSKEQPTEEELRAIEAWVRSGAAGLPAPSANPPAPEPSAGDKPATPAAEPETTDQAPPPTASAPPPDTVPAANLDAIAALRGVLAFAAPVGQGSSLLAVDFSAAQTALTSAEIADLLRPLAANIVDLKIARRTLDDSLAPVLAAMVRLQRLDLRGSTLSEACTRAAAALPALEELTLVGTTLPSTCAAEIARGPALRKAYVWKSSLTEEDIAKLRESRPELQIDSGEVATAEALEIEPEIKFTSDAPVPGAPQTAATLTPVNTLCPVSGKPIDPRYLVVHEGKVIGFCCPNCPGEFWKDPTKYAVKP